jgi:hypothetical protein
MKLSTQKLTALTAAGVMALSAASVAQAKHGADDPAGHKRGADDVQPHFKHGADDPAGHKRGRDDVRPHFKHGADDPAGHKRGADDGPNHR